jgi:hypothetical protein
MDILANVVMATSRFRGEGAATAASWSDIMNCITKSRVPPFINESESNRALPECVPQIGA